MNILQKSACLYALVSTAAIAQHSVSNQIIVGTTLRSNPPAIFNSLDGGLSWSLQSISLLPSTGKNGSHLDSIYCSDKSLCLSAGGLYSSGMDDRIPLIIRSVDNGRNWSYINVNSDALYLKSITCQDTFCIATGDREKNYWHYPVILTSDDSGETWKNVSDVPGKSISNAPTSASACNSHICVVGGGYKIEEMHYLPILMVTTDKGHHWKQIEKINQFPGGIYVQINSVKCHESICIASGHYHASTNRRVGAHGMILVSNIDGTEWTYINHAIKDEKCFNLEASDSFCHKNICLIVGNSSAYLYSADSGKNWELHHDIRNLPEASGRMFDAIACDNDGSCTAVGSYDTKDGYYPMILNSSDYGRSWEFNNNIPSTQGSLSNVHCNAQNCIAVGYVFPKNYILSSNDKGRTWTYQDTLPGLPQEDVFRLNDMASSSWVLQ